LAVQHFAPLQLGLAQLQSCFSPRQLGRTGFGVELEQRLACLNDIPPTHRPFGQMGIDLAEDLHLAHGQQFPLHHLNRRMGLRPDYRGFNPKSSRLLSRRRRLRRLILRTQEVTTGYPENQQTGKYQSNKEMITLETLETLTKSGRKRH